MLKETETKQKIAELWPDLQVEEPLGGGAFGVVYACTRTDAVTGITQQEAVKAIRVAFTEEDRANAAEEGLDFAEYYRRSKEKRLQEIKWMVELKSPHIVHINAYGAAEEPDFSALYIFIRMDRLTSLDKLRAAHLDDTPEQAAALAEKVFRDLCEALRVCHAKGVCHRDIKPANILCDAAGEFYLGDFGISRDADPQRSGVTSSGTLEYAPREAATGQFSQRSDLYSLGLVLYALVNHWRAPFLPAYPDAVTPEDRSRAQYKRLNGAPLPAPDNCTPAMAALLRKLCAPAPEDRFSSAEEVLDALQNPASLLADAAPAPLPQPPEQPTGAAVPQKSRKALSRRAKCGLAAGVLCAAVACGAGLAVYNRTRFTAPDISLGAEEDAGVAAQSAAENMQTGSEDFMLTNGLTYAQSANAAIPGGAIAYLIDPQTEQPLEASDADCYTGNLTLAFISVTHTENEDGSTTYTLILAETAEMYQRRTEDAPIYGVGARFRPVLLFDPLTGTVYPYKAEDYAAADSSYSMISYFTAADGSTLEVPVTRETAWRVSGEAAATEAVDKLDGYGVPGMVMHIPYTRNQRITLQVPQGIPTPGLLICTDPYSGDALTAEEGADEAQPLSETADFTGYDHYLYYSLSELEALCGSTDAE